MAFHTFDILTKNEFLKRDVLALILLRKSPGAPRRECPKQKETYLSIHVSIWWPTVICTWKRTIYPDIQANNWLTIN